MLKNFRFFSFIFLFNRVITYLFLILEQLIIV